MKDRKLQKSLALPGSFSWSAVLGYLISFLLMDVKIAVITANTEYSMARSPPTAPRWGQHLQFLCQAMEIPALPATAVSEGAGCSTYHAAHKLPIISLQLNL